MLHRPLPEYEIARQIAGLLNDHNSLSRKRYGPEIREGSTEYVAETHGKLVIGAVGIRKVSPVLSEVKHLVVRPEWRRKGIAKFILKRGMSLATTPLLYAMIRADNSASLELFQSVGFTRGQDYQAADHKVALLTRNSPTWKTSPRQSRQSSGKEPTWQEVTGSSE